MANWLTKLRFLYEISNITSKMNGFLNYIIAKQIFILYFLSRLLCFLLLALIQQPTSCLLQSICINNIETISKIVHIKPSTFYAFICIYLAERARERENFSFHLTPTDFPLMKKKETSHFCYKSGKKATKIRLLSHIERYGQ